METNYYPPVGFYFTVAFSQKAGFGEVDSQFQSVSGLSVEMETMEVVEGGENRFKHKLPVSTRYPNLVLKRGMVLKSELLDWCRAAMENFEFTPHDLTVSLLNNKGEPLKTWQIVAAYPVKMDVSEFNANDNSIAIETLEFTYKYFTVKNGQGNTDAEKSRSSTRKIQRP